MHRVNTHRWILHHPKRIRHDPRLQAVLHGRILHKVPPKRQNDADGWRTAEPPPSPQLLQHTPHGLCRSSKLRACLGHRIFISGQEVETLIAAPPDLGLLVWSCLCRGQDGDSLFAHWFHEHFEVGHSVQHAVPERKGVSLVRRHCTIHANLKFAICAGLALVETVGL